jgi:DNA-directed RNA polymerase specialized sigma54-like protein
MEQSLSPNRTKQIQNFATLQSKPNNLTVKPIARVVKLRKSAIITRPSSITPTGLTRLNFFFSSDSKKDFQSSKTKKVTQIKNVTFMQKAAKQVV